MAGVHRLTVQESVAPGATAFDRNADYASLPKAVGSAAAPANNTADFGPTRAIHVNVEGTYQLKFDGGGDKDMVLNVGVTYPFSVVNVLTAGAGGIATDAITLIY